MDDQEKKKGRDFFDYVLLLAQNKKLIVRLACGGFLLSLLISFIMPNIYTGEVSFIAPQTYPKLINQVFVTQMAMADILTKGSLLEQKTPQDLYTDILQTNTIFDKIIKKFDLMKLYDCDYIEEARKELSKVFKIEIGKGSVMILRIDDKDPQRAADMANAFVKELMILLDHLDNLESAKRNEYFSSQLQETKAKLEEAENSFKLFKENTMLIETDKQAENIVTYLAQLKALVDSKDVELKVKKTYATAQNYDIRRIEEELLGLREKLRAMEASSSVRREGDVFIPTKNIPDLSLQYIRKYRDVKYYETLFELLSKLKALGNIDANNDAYTTLVIGWSLVPTMKSKPKRGLIVLGATFFSLLLAIIWIFIISYFDRFKHNEEDTARLYELQQSLRFPKIQRLSLSIRKRLKP